MVKRIITALGIVIVAFGCLYLGGYFTSALVALIALAGSFEILKLNANYKIWDLKLVLFFIIALVVCILTPQKISLMILASLVILLMAFPIFAKNFNSEDSIYYLGVLLLFYTFTKSFLFIYESNSLYIWFIILGTYGCDTGAYFIGSFYGNTKLIPHISPNKTVEGSLGGWACGAIISLIFGIVAIKNMPILLLVLGCLWIPVISQVGDLAFSAMKRHFNIKDFSNIFPGHGGFMDRVDSLVFSLMFFAILLIGITL